MTWEPINISRALFTFPLVFSSRLVSYLYFIDSLPLLSALGSWLGGLAAHRLALILSSHQYSRKFVTSSSPRLLQHWQSQSQTLKAR